MENLFASPAIRRTDLNSVGLRSPMPCMTMPMPPTARPILYNLVIPRNGLQLPPQLSFDTWLEVGRRLSAIATSSAWCLGDWLIYGETSFTGRYREAIERTSLDYQTL